MSWFIVIIACGSDGGAVFWVSNA